MLQRHSIGTTSVQYAHWFLKEMSDEVNQVITAICEEQCMLADKVHHSSDVTCFYSSYTCIYLEERVKTRINYVRKLLV